MSKGIEILSHENEGFKVLVEYQSWRTAVLNRGKENTPEFISYVEKHKETDEVFVLLKGKAYLIDGGTNETPNSFETLCMELYKTYNVKAKVWHAVVMSADASIFIVENLDTAKENSDYHDLTIKEKETILSGISL